MAQVDSNIKLANGEISQGEWDTLRQRLSFMKNPDEMVTCYRKLATGEIAVPRGAWYWLPRRVRNNMRDKRSFPKLPKHETDITLDFQSDTKKFYGQRECIDAMFNPKNHQQGFIHRQPGSGKSNIACYFMANVGTRSLVIVHTYDLVKQWVEYAERVIPTMPVGFISAGKEDVQQLTIATLQTLYRRDYDEEWYRQFGCVIHDECLHAPAKTFSYVLSRIPSRYRFGMSASEKRADNMQPLVNYLFGKKIHNLEFSSAVPVTVRKVESNFTRYNTRAKNKYHGRYLWLNMLDALTNDEHRNKLIAHHVNRELNHGRSVLVLSRRINHLQAIQEFIEHDSEVMAAKLLNKAERKDILERFKSGELKCVLATQLADEGLDVPILSCVALVFPGKQSDLVLQQVGRALREYQGKDSAMILDVVDSGVKTLNSHWHTRRRSYREWGFTIKGNGVKDRVPIPLVARSPVKAYKRRRQVKRSDGRSPKTFYPKPKKSA